MKPRFSESLNRGGLALNDQGQSRLAGQSYNRIEGSIVQTKRAASGIVSGILCVLMVTACGGGNGGYSAPPAATVNISVNPTQITLGESAVVTWSSNSGTSCTASGAWSGNLQAAGNQTVMPTAVGNDVFTLNCTGGVYGNGAASATLAVSGGSAFSMTALIADTAGGTAGTTDQKLANPWGIVIPAGDRPAAVANNHSETAKLYDGNGKPQFNGDPLTVNTAAAADGTTFDPTGIVFNLNTADFLVTEGTATGSALLIFAGESGTIGGWSPQVDLAKTIAAYTDAGGAVYKGLTMAPNSGSQFLYATDFHNNKVDVFDRTFQKQATSATAFTFNDPAIPAGFAPFGIQALATGANGAMQVYVTYAKQQAPDNHDNANGAGLGYVDVYDTNGQLLKRLVSGGALNAPWGIALAPADFGSLSGAVLIGNFGDGKINGYDVIHGGFFGSVNNAAGVPIANPGLWGIAFGNDAQNQPHNTLFFSAGPNDEANGLYGRIDLGATPPVLNAPPVVTLNVPSGNLAGTVTLSATVQDALDVETVVFFVNGVEVGSGVPSAVAPFSLFWDSTTVANGPVTIIATAHDLDDNVGTSAPVTATVANPAAAQVTLSQLQTEIFTPICSACHNGSGTTLPGVQNLTAGNSFANLVNVTSLELPPVVRIKPNDVEDSYLVQKILGATGIVGARMPLGCGPSSNPCLDQPTIDKVKAWINQGALNN